KKSDRKEILRFYYDKWKLWRKESMFHIEKGKREENQIELKVTMEPDTVDEAFKEIYHEFSQKVKVPGFRTGRVPINILEMNLGKEYINQQVAEKLIKESYSKAIEESELDPIDVPKVELIQIEKDKPFIYKIILELKPEFEIPALGDISLEKKQQEVTEQEIEAELEKLRESHAKLKAIENRESQMGDFLVLDFEAFLNGKSVENSKAEKQIIQLGERVPPEFNENLTGVKPDEEKEIIVKYPDNVNDKKLAGKEITYKIKVLEIKEKELPELDDDFAKSVGDYQKLDDLKVHIEKQLNEQAKFQTEREFQDLLMEKVSEKCIFEVPEVLIEKQLEHMFNNLKEDLKIRNMTLEEYYKLIKADEEKVRKEYRLIAEKQIKQELIIDKIIQDDKITATEEEVNKKIEEIAESTNQKPLKVRAMFEKNKTLDNLKEQIKRDKAIAVLSEKIKIIEK
ncbi:MAG TPA: trigger factor, partial [Atribacterota bacterium]|nr:trigger factor [Atribacterota bacterium]